MTFKKFKQLFGNLDGEKGVKLVKLGNQTFEIDTINYKYKKAPAEP